MVPAESGQDVQPARGQPEGREDRHTRRHVLCRVRGEFRAPEPVRLDRIHATEVLAQQAPQVRLPGIGTQRRPSVVDAPAGTPLIEHSRPPFGVVSKSSSDARQRRDGFPRGSEMIVQPIQSGVSRGRPRHELVQGPDRAVRPPRVRRVARDTTIQTREVDELDARTDSRPARGGASRWDNQRCIPAPGPTTRSRTKGSPTGVAQRRASSSLSASIRWARTTLRPVPGSAGLDVWVMVLPP